MKVSSIDFLKAKYGKGIIFKYHCYEDSQYEGSQWSGDLEEIMNELLSIALSDDIVQVQNPRNGNYTIIDREAGNIITSLNDKLPGIEILTPKKHETKKR